MSLTCPKCHGAMRSYERNGVTIDQCTECRGVFLDRGELEHLVDAEDRWYRESGRSGSPAGPAAAPATASGYGGASPGHGAGPSGHPGAAGAAGASAGGLGAVVGEVLRQAGQSRSGHGSSGHSPSRTSSSGYPQKRKKSFLDELFG